MYLDDITLGGAVEVLLQNLNVISSLVCHLILS